MEPVSQTWTWSLTIIPPLLWARVSVKLLICLIKSNLWWNVSRLVSSTDSQAALSETIIMKMTRIMLHSIKTMLELIAAWKIYKKSVVLDDTEWCFRIILTYRFKFKFWICFLVMWWCYWYDGFILSSRELLYTFPSLSKLFWWFQSNMKS